MLHHLFSRRHLPSIVTNCVADAYDIIPISEGKYYPTPKCVVTLQQPSQSQNGYR